MPRNHPPGSPCRRRRQSLALGLYSAPPVTTMARNKCPGAIQSPLAHYPPPRKARDGAMVQFNTAYLPSSVGSHLQSAAARQINAIRLCGVSSKAMAMKSSLQVERSVEGERVIALVCNGGAFSRASPRCLVGGPQLLEHRPPFAGAHLCPHAGVRDRSQRWPIGLELPALDLRMTSR